MKTEHLDCSHCDYWGKSIFCELDSQGLKQVSENKCMSSYKKGEFVYLQGALPTGLYCVHAGKVKLTSTSNDGKSTIISIVTPGQLFGHINVFNNEAYQTTATVIEESKICYLEKKFFFTLLQEQPTVSLQLVTHLAREMGAAEKSISDLTQKTIRARLATFLLDAAKNFGKENQNKITLDIKLTREEMASLIGGATETLIRLMTELKDEGIIAQNRKTIQILDLKALEKQAEF